MLLQKARKGVPIQYVYVLPRDRTGLDALLTLWMPMMSYDNRIHPQPADLPDPWEVCLAVPDAGKDKNYSSAIAMQIYVNSADTRIQVDRTVPQRKRHSLTVSSGLQRSDPRPPPEDEEGPLPAGWEKCSDEGEAYYHNLNTDVLTYDDPRVVVNPHPSQYLEAKYQNNPFLNMVCQPWQTYCLSDRLREYHFTGCRGQVWDYSPKGSHTKHEGPQAEGLEHRALRYGRVCRFG